MKDIVVHLDLDAGKLHAKMRGAKGEIKTFAREVESYDGSVKRAQRSTGTFTHRLRDLVIVGAGVRFAIHAIGDTLRGTFGQLIKANAEFEKLQILMQGMDKSGRVGAEAIKAAKVEMMELVAFAQQTPYSISNVQDSFIKLKSAGIDPLNGSMQALVDSTAKYGKTGEELKRAGIAIQQMAGKGVVSMEELRQQLGEAVPDAIMTMARGLHTNMAELVKAISTGTVGAETALRALFIQMELQNGGAAAKLAQTWEGTTARLESRFKVAMLTMGGDSDGFFQELKDSLTYFTDEVMTSREAQQIFAQIGEGLKTMAVAIKQGAGFISEHGRLIKDLATLYIGFKVATYIGGMSIFSKLTWDSLKLGNAKKALAVTTASLSRAFKVESTQLMLSGAKITTYTRATTMAQISSIAMARGVGIATRAVKGLGMVLKTALGPASLLFLTVEGAFWIWDRFKDKTADIASELQNLNAETMTYNQLMEGRSILEAKTAEQTAVLDNIAAHQKKLRIIQDDIAAADKRQADSVAAGTSTEESTAVWQQIRTNQQAAYENLQFAMSKLKADAKEMGVELTNIGAVLNDATISLGGESGQKAFAAYIKQNQAFFDKTQSDYILGVEALDKALAASSATHEEKTKERLKKETELRKIKLDKDLEVQTKFRDQQVFMLSNLGGESDKASQGERARIVAVIKLLDDVIDRNEALRESITLGQATVENGTSQTAKLNPLMEFYERLKTTHQKMIAKNEEQISQYGELEALVQSIESSANGLTEEQKALLPVIRAELAAVQELTELTKQWKDDQNEIADSLKRAEQISATWAAKAAKSKNDNPFKAPFVEANKALGELNDAIVDNAALMERYRRDPLYKAENRTLAEAIALNKELLAAKGAVAKATFDEITRLSNAAVDKGANKGSQLEQQRAGLAALRDTMKEAAAGLDLTIVGAQATQDVLMKNAKAIEDQIAQTATGMELLNGEMTDSALQWAVAIDSLIASKVSGLFDALGEGFITGKLNMRAFFDDFTQQLMALTLKTLAYQTILAAIGGDSASAGATAFLGKMFGVTTSANGNVMTGQGPRNLKAYANGGIAYEPQLSLFGEGSTPEAYVPLPDGRTIPVTMQGGGGSANVKINVINQGAPATAEVGSTQFDGENTIVNVILKKLGQPGPLREAIRGSR